MLKQLLQLGGNIKNYIVKNSHNEFLIFLFFVFIATVFWLTQTLNETYTTHYNVPLQLKNIPQSVVLTEEPPPYIDVTITDKGTTLMDYRYNHRITPIIIDFASYDQQQNHIRLLPDQLRQAIKLYPSSTVNAIHPDTIHIIYTQGGGKRIPVQVERPNTAGKQFYVAQITQQPESVTVYAPQSLLQRLEAAHTLPFAIGDMTDTLHYVAIKPVVGAKFVPDSVQVHLATDIYSEKSVEVSIVGSGFPSDLTLKTFPAKATITFQVGLSQFKRITAADFEVAVTYETLQQSHSHEVPLCLLHAPECATNVRITPAEVDYIIEKNR